MTRSDVVLTVIRYLGRLAVFLIIGTLYLTWVVIDQAGKVGTVDPVAVGLVGSSWTLTGSVVTALATLLVSTRSADEPQPVTVENPPADPVNVTEAGHVDPSFLVLVVIAVCVVAITWHYLAL